MSKVLHERRAGGALFFLGATEALPKFGWTNQARALSVHSRRPIQTICISYGMRIRVSYGMRIRVSVKLLTRRGTSSRSWIGVFKPGPVGSPGQCTL